MAFINLENVYFGYPDENGNTKNVLSGINISIEKGEFVTILGRNGSGKSTAARIMNGLIKADSGNVEINGICPKSESNIWEIRKCVGMVFQNPDNQIVESLVLQDIAFGCENLGIESSEILKRIDESLENVGMSQYKEAMTAYLSGGQKQRIAIAGVLAMKPQCIIFDEATSMLDPKGRKDILKIMKKLNSAGITVINITHFMDEALLSDNVIIIDNGKVLKKDSPENIFCDVGYMKNIKLDVPQITELAYMLRNKGYSLSEGIFDEKKLFEEMTKYKYVKSDCMEKKSESKAQGEAIIELENVSCIYAEGTHFSKTALNDVSFKINKGEFAAVIGHTGSGKSTLMQTFSGLIKLSKGKVLFKDKDIYSSREYLKEVRQKIGVVFQYPEYQLFEATVFDDVAFAPKNQKLSDNEIKKRVSDSLKAVGLSEEYFEKSPFRLSGGEKRRAAIAGILAMKPEVLVLDEPAAALDPAGRDEILGYIEKIHSEMGITVIIVSHSMEDVAKYADRIIVMNEGKAVLNGAPKEIFKEELSAIGLGVPKMAETARYFSVKGCPVSEDIYTSEEMVQELERHFEK